MIRSELVQICSRSKIPQDSAKDWEVLLGSRLLSLEGMDPLYLGELR